MSTASDGMPCAISIGTGPYTVGQVKRALAENLKLELTTGECVKRWGRSTTFWRRRAMEGAVEDAYQDDAGTWRLPVQSVTEYLAKLKLPKGTRGPWSARQPQLVEDDPVPVDARPPFRLSILREGQEEHG